MATIINIPGSTGKTPFELCDEQFFYCTSSEISTLAARGSMADPFGYMQMGHTNLYFFQRLILSDRVNGIYRTYPETNEVNRIKKNQYWLIGNVYLHTTSPNGSFAFSSLTEAEEYMKSLKSYDQNSIYIVARLLHDEDWH